MPSLVPSLAALALTAIAAAALCAVLIVVLMPLLKRYALARPNGRSSHVVPTPQGGGVAVIAATLAVTGAFLALAPSAGTPPWGQFLVLFVAAGALAGVGCVDDIWTIDVLPRLILQFVAVIAVTVAMPNDIHIVSALPLWLERAVLVIVGVWLVNLVNFMDGLDWMTVVEVAAITLGITLIGLIGTLPPLSVVLAVALLGAIVGFAPFNRPVARLFLGDVGSLPIGLLLFWLLCQVAGSGYIAAAILLPLYYFADATVTLARRFLNGERISQAHRSHFYQRATELGFPVPHVIGLVTIFNGLLVLLALISVWIHTPLADIVTLILGGGAVLLLLTILSRGKR